MHNAGVEHAEGGAQNIMDRLNILCNSKLALTTLENNNFHPDYWYNDNINVMVNVMRSNLSGPFTILLCFKW